MINSYINILVTSSNPALDFFRDILYNMTSGIYSLVSLVFELFFDITDYTMFDNEMAKGLFSRLFIIIGVFMLFKLSISFISYLINPETMKDKDKGIGKLFGRLITMLVLLYLLMPMDNFHMWGDAETDAKYQSNGLLFGALYDLQSRVINDGAISELILGEDITSNGNVKNLNLGENVANTIHGAFLTISDVDDECKETASDVLEQALKGKNLSTVINLDCSAGSNAGDYMFEYNGITAFLVGIGVLIIVFMFCFDVAIRMFKLGILRLLSPIPAISYIDPKSSRDGMFANYVKTLTSTYLDLFLRLAIIYLVIFILADIAKNDETLFSGMSSPSFAKVIVYISLLFFAAQAPKFIMQSLGIKSKGTGLGFGAALLGGAVSGMLSGARTGDWTGAIGGLVKGAGAANRNFWTASNGGQSQGSGWRVGGTEGVRFGTNNPQERYEGIVDRTLSNLHNAHLDNKTGATNDEFMRNKKGRDENQAAANLAQDARRQLTEALQLGIEAKVTIPDPSDITKTITFDMNGKSKEDVFQQIANLDTAAREYGSAAEAYSKNMETISKFMGQHKVVRGSGSDIVITAKDRYIASKNPAYSVYQEPQASKPVTKDPSGVDRKNY